jgi:2-hydroxy-3-keto-5-methylthiopentenyl-1-phosphate phosphatase
VSAAGDGWAVVCDFDGTATTEDIGDQVSIRFAGHGHWRAAEDRYAAGEFPFAQLLRAIFAPVTASAAEIAAFAAERAVLRDGFVPFLADCQARGRPFVVCSAGLDVYIEPVLARLPADLRRHLWLRANEGRCSPQGMAVAFHGGGAFDCGRCGFCKGAVVRQLQAAGRRVVFLGDGTADRCGARAADRVFARRSLVRWCREEGIAFDPFESFAEVQARFPGEPPRPAGGDL